MAKEKEIKKQTDVKEVRNLEINKKKIKVEKAIRFLFLWEIKNNGKFLNLAGKTEKFYKNSRFLRIFDKFRPQFIISAIPGCLQRAIRSSCRFYKGLLADSRGPHKDWALWENLPQRCSHGMQQSPDVELGKSKLRSSSVGDRLWHWIGKEFTEESYQRTFRRESAVATATSKQVFNHVFGKCWRCWLQIW